MQVGIRSNADRSFQPRSGHGHHRPGRAENARPLVPASTWSVTSSGCGCDRRPRLGAATCKRFAPSCRTVLPDATSARRWPESPPAPSAWSSPACEDESAWSPPVPNIPQHRSCHEESRSPRGDVIIRDGTISYRAGVVRGQSVCFDTS